MSQQNTNLIIFDFDGTIADSFSVLLEIMNQLAQEGGIPRFTAEQVAQAREMPMREIITALKIPRWRLPFLARKIQKRFAEKIKDVRPVDGIVPVLEGLKAQGRTLGVLSSTRQETIERFMERNQIGAFAFIHSEKNLFGKAKILRKILEGRSSVPAEAVYVGDESRDIDAAHEAEMRSVSVTWGFNSKKMLVQHQPDFLIEKPEELLTINF